MDLNPRRFEAPWEEYEFATHCAREGVRVVVVSMAWMAAPWGEEMDEAVENDKEKPDLMTLRYWIDRMDPLLQGDKEIIVVFANRAGREGEVVYAGTSAVVGVNQSELEVYGLIGRGIDNVLKVELPWKVDGGTDEVLEVAKTT
jgi:hypothetical protein